jgi:homospermidine synthase
VTLDEHSVWVSASRCPVRRPSAQPPLTGGPLADFVWAMRDPHEDLVEFDSPPFDGILSLYHPCLDEVRGVFSNRQIPT